jgi:hypothetical protein
MNLLSVLVGAAKATSLTYRIVFTSILIVQLIKSVKKK